ncbi:MAG: BON domain-containing protein [Pseudomonadota bacterium]
MNIKHIAKSVSVATLISIGVASYANAANAPEPKSANVSTAISDAAITTKVKAKYLEDKRLKDSDISVTTANGVVSLTGTAPSAEAKSAAEEVAKTVEGVLNVGNDIQTPSLTSQVEKKTKRAAKKTERVVSDSWITTKVKSSLLADSVTKGFKISVKTVNHVVALSGTVDSQASIDHATDLAKQIEGVASVDASALVVGVASN